MDWKTETIRTYDSSAKDIAEYFKVIGSRVDDIELGLKLAKAGDDARVVEIGCGDGRDAAEIVKRVSWYQGFDPSEGLLAIARENLPDVSFVKADALSYDYPADIDVVYAFASLLHINQNDLKVVFSKVANALLDGGAFYLSLRERPYYQEECQEDEFGKRMFYYYNPQLIERVAGASFSVSHESHQKIGSNDWLTLCLTKG